MKSLLFICDEFKKIKHALCIDKKGLCDVL